MTSSVISYILLLTLLFTSCSSDHAGNGTEVKSYSGAELTTAAVDSFLESRMKEYRIPGLSFALINDGQVAHQKMLGYANLARKVPVTGQTIFEGASLSKSVFAFFVMTYVEEGRLDLDRPLYEYLPYPDIAHDERYKKITARMVLSHRSGFPNWRENEEDGKLKIAFEPGTGYEYSGEGYQYLAMVLRHLENTDEKGLEAAFQRRVAQPLGMSHTVFIQTPYTRKHKAEPYDEGNMWIDWKNSYWYKKSDGKFSAASSLHSEPIDFSRWMIAVMKKELLSEESYAELFTPHSPVPSGGDTEVSYTLGFMKPHIPDTDLYFHGGDNTGFTCFYVLDPERDWGYVVFTNSEYGEELGNELADYLMAESDG